MQNANKHVEYISYTGRFPNYCRGTLALRIDGEIVTFGFQNAMFNMFWEEACCLNEDEFVKRLPEQFRKYAKEIKSVFDTTAKLKLHCCCGGCE